MEFELNSPCRLTQGVPERGDGFSVGCFAEQVLGFGHHGEGGSPRRTFHVFGDEVHVQVRKFVRKRLAGDPLPLEGEVR